MRRLGYERYGAQGGDWGAAISRELGRTQPDRVIGVHLNLLPGAAASTEPTADELAALSPDERERTLTSWPRSQAWRREQQGYADIQSTRPQTLAYALTDSPVGQLAWIAEKFREWTDSRDTPEDAVDRDQLLTNVMLYWLTGTAGSSARIYYERAHADYWGTPPEPSTLRPPWPSSRTRTSSPCGTSPNGPTTSCDGRSTTAADTSPRWRSQTSWSRTCGRSSGRFAQQGRELDRWAQHARKLSAHGPPTRAIARARSTCALRRALPLDARPDRHDRVRSRRERRDIAHATSFAARLSALAPTSTTRPPSRARSSSTSDSACSSPANADCRVGRPAEALRGSPRWRQCIGITRAKPEFGTERRSKLAACAIAWLEWRNRARRRTSAFACRQHSSALVAELRVARMAALSACPGAAAFESSSDAAEVVLRS